MWLRCGSHSGCGYFLGKSEHVSWYWQRAYHEVLCRCLECDGGEGCPSWENLEACLIFV